MFCFGRGFKRCLCFSNPFLQRSLSLAFPLQLSLSSPHPSPCRWGPSRPRQRSRSAPEGRTRKRRCHSSTSRAAQACRAFCCCCCCRCRCLQRPQRQSRPLRRAGELPWRGPARRRGTGRAEELASSSLGERACEFCFHLLLAAAAHDRRRELFFLSFFLFSFPRLVTFESPPLALLCQQCCNPLPTFMAEAAVFWFEWKLEKMRVSFVFRLLLSLLFYLAPSTSTSPPRSRSSPRSLAPPPSEAPSKNRGPHKNLSQNES